MKSDPFQSFESEQEAVDLANESEYGLASALFSADPERCDRVRKALRSGIVWINCGQPAFIQVSIYTLFSTFSLNN